MILSFSRSFHLCELGGWGAVPLPTWLFSGKQEGWEQETPQNTSQPTGDEYLKKWSEKVHVWESVRLSVEERKWITLKKKKIS